jgi:hypothetical protein
MLSLHISACVHHNNNHSFCYNKEKKEGHGKYLFFNSWLSSLDIIIKILQDYISTCNYFSLCVKTQCGIHVIGYWWIAESFFMQMCYMLVLSHIKYVFKCHLTICGEGWLCIHVGARPCFFLGDNKNSSSW